MKNIKKMLCLLVSVVMVLSFAACSDSKEKSTDSGADSSAANEPQIQSDAVASESDGAQNDQAQSENDVAIAESEGAEGQQSTGGKYADVEIYENEDGNKAAKTESGVEVEITGENMEDLYEKYQAALETDPEKAQEYLDQMQVILDNVDDMGE